MPPATNKHIGRRVAVGLGIESTPGTAVAPSIWPRQTGLDFQRRSTVIQNNSAMGRNEAVNDSAVVEQWADGSLEGKVYDLSIGYLLYSIFGLRTTSPNADASGIVRDHLFEVAASNAPPSLTVVRRDPVTNRRHALAALRRLEITGANNDWVKVKADLVARAGVAGTDVPAYVTENAFVGRHVAIKLANATAGFGAAPAIAAKTFRFTIERPVTPFFQFGSNEPAEMDSETFNFNGEVVLRYKSSEYEDLWFNNTRQALQLSIVNTDFVIGTSANPGLVLTAPQVRLNTFARSNDLDTVVEQTVGFSGELDTVAGYMLRALLTNTQVSY